MSNRITAGDEARKQIKEGIDAVANTIKVTLGPNGRNVVLDTNPYGNPVNTNDGVTIARELSVPGKLQNTGAKLVREVAGKTNDVAGDGTTTASVLVQAITTEALKALSADSDAVQLRRGIEIAAGAVIDELESVSVKIEDLKSLRSIATISCGDPELGDLVAEMVHKVGATGLVTLEDNAGISTESELSEGLELRGGYPYPVFVTNQQRQQAIIDGAPIFVTNHALTNGLEVVKIMEACANQGHKQAVVIASSIDGEALASSIINWVQGKFQLLPVRVQALGSIGEEVLRDVAEITGATFFAKEEGFKLPAEATDSLSFEHFGSADRIVATKDRTTVIGGAGDADARVEVLKAKLPNLKDYEKESTQERIAKIQSGVGIIKVGGATDTEREERKLRIEDAINATKAALEDGVLPGGGAALYRASYVVASTNKRQAGDIQLGCDAVTKACMAPLKQIAKNSSIALDRTDMAQVLNDGKLTIDFKSGDVVDAQGAGVLDPTKVVVSALRYASSAAALFITTEAAVVTEDEEKGETI